MIIKSAAIILISNGKALLQLRDNSDKIAYPNHWGFAGGGKLEEGETFLQAAQRELREETNYISKNPIQFMSAKYELPNGKKVNTIRFFEIYDDIQKLNCNEGQKIKFMTLEEMNNVKMYPSVKEAIEIALEKAKSPY